MVLHTHLRASPHEKKEWGKVPPMKKPIKLLKSIRRWRKRETESIRGGGASNQKWRRDGE